MKPEQDQPVVAFNYDTIDPEHREKLEEDARQIRKRLVDTARALLEIGMHLHRARKLLPHGAWRSWLLAETGMSEQWSRDCLNLYQRFGDRPEMIKELDLALAPTAIVRLATAPETACQEILDRVQGGERLRVADVEETVRLHRRREQETDGNVSRASEESGIATASEALRRMAEDGRDALVPRIVERLQKLLDYLIEVDRRWGAGDRVTAKELQGLRPDAQWLSDALEQVTQRRAASDTKLVHHTFLERGQYDAGPWAELAAFLRDISSSDGCAATIRRMGVAAFVERGGNALWDVLSPPPPHPPLPRRLRRIWDSLEMDWIVCLEDGRRVKDLGAHLTELGMTADEYRTRWHLPDAYPMLAPSEILRRGPLYEYLPETGEVIAVAEP